MLKYLLFSIAIASLIGCSSTPEPVDIAHKTCKISTAASVENDIRVAGFTRVDCTHYELSEEAAEALAKQCDVKYKTVVYQNKSGEEMIFNCPGANGGYVTGSYIKLY